MRFPFILKPTIDIRVSKARLLMCEAEAESWSPSKLSLFLVLECLINGRLVIIKRPSGRFHIRLHLPYSWTFLFLPPPTPCFKRAEGSYIRWKSLWIVVLLYDLNAGASRGKTMSMSHWWYLINRSGSIMNLGRTEVWRSECKMFDLSVRVDLSSEVTFLCQRWSERKQFFFKRILSQKQQSSSACSRAATCWPSSHNPNLSPLLRTDGLLAWTFSKVRWRASVLWGGDEVMCPMPSTVNESILKDRGGVRGSAESSRWKGLTPSSKNGPDVLCVFILCLRWRLKGGWRCGGGRGGGGVLYFDGLETCQLTWALVSKIPAL